MSIRINGLVSSSGGTKGSRFLTASLMLLLVTTVSCSHDDTEQVKSLLRVRMAGNLDAQREYKVFRKTQAALLTSPFVLTSALRDANLANQPILKSVDDPVQWLHDNVIATFADDSEIMKITCPAAPDDQAKVIIDGIVRAYQSEVMQSDRDRAFAELETLEHLYSANNQSMQDMAERIHSLAVQVGIDNSVATQLNRELAIEKVKSLQHRVADLEAKLLNARANELLAKNESSEAGLGQMKAASEVYELLLTEQQESLEAAIKQITNKETFSPEYVTLQNQLEQLKSESLVLLQEINRLKLKLSMPSRVQLVQPAE